MERFLHWSIFPGAYNHIGTTLVALLVFCRIPRTELCLNILASLHIHLQVTYWDKDVIMSLKSLRGNCNVPHKSWSCSFRGTSVRIYVPCNFDTWASLTMKLWYYGHYTWCEGNITSNIFGKVVQTLFLFWGFICLVSGI